MAQTKKTPAKIKVMAWKPSWRRLLVAGSVTLNIAFLIVFYLMAFTHTLDVMFIREGIDRYCDSTNNELFTDATVKTKALRSYTCASPDAKMYFDKGFNSYLDAKGIPHD